MFFSLPNKDKIFNGNVKIKIINAETMRNHNKLRYVKKVSRLN